jgi:hypothetical protein
MHSHAERGNDQGEAGDVGSLEDESAVAVGNVHAKVKVTADVGCLRCDAARQVSAYRGCMHLKEVNRLRNCHL